MSMNIDERVVEMRFDNQQFEHNVQTSLGTLDKLKNSLRLEDAVKGFENLDQAAGKMDLGILNGAIESVKQGFSTFEIMAITALANITNSAVNTGRQLVSSLTIDQVTAGWQKYADKTSSVQTIMAATRSQFADTGEQMEYVDDQLGKLNWFTDETSYSFLDMVNNIGKFTSAGVELDTSVTAMEGISTWAAMSGAGIDGASRAMYNLSQALGTGAVKLQDWKSIENANMATVEFKQTVIDTAVELGVLEDAGDGLYKTVDGVEVSVTNFNQNLKEGWFNSEVLLASLEKYGGFTDKLYEASDALSGQYDTVSELISAVDEYAAGELNLDEVIKNTGLTAEEVTAIFDELSNSQYDLGRRAFAAAQEAKTFQEAIDATKDAVSTGWLNTFELIFGNYEEAKVLWTNVANELYDVFAASSEARNEMLGEWKDLGGRDAFLQAVSNAWEGLKNIINTVKDAFREVFPPMTADRLVEITEKVRDFTEKFKLSDETLGKIKDTFKGLFSVIDIVRQVLSALVGGVKNLLTPVKNLSGGVLDLAGRFGDWLSNLRNTLAENETFKKIVETIVGYLQKVPELLSGAFKSITGISIGDALDRIREKASALYDKIKTLLGISEDSSAMDQLSGAMKRASDVASSATGVFSGIRDLFSKLWELAKNLATAFKDAFSPIKESTEGINLSFLDSISSFLSDLIQNLISVAESGITSLLDLIVAVTPRIAEAVSTILSSVLGLINTYIPQIAETIVSLLDTILKTISDHLPSILQSVWNIIIGFLRSIRDNIGEVVSVILEIVENVIDAISAKLPDILDRALSGGVAVAIIGAIKEIFGSESVLGSVKDLLGGIGDVLGAWQKNIQSKSLMNIAIAIGVLTASLVALSFIDDDKIISSLTALGVLIQFLLHTLSSLTTQIAGLKMSDVNKAKKSATALIEIAAALLILSVSLEKISKLNWEELAKGLIGVGVLMAELVGFTKFADMGGMNFSSGVGLILFAESLNILAGALQKIGVMSWGEIAKSLTVLTIALAELSISLNLMDGTLSGSAALMVAAAGLLLLAPAVKSFGEMSVSEIAKSLITLGIALAELSVALNLMNGTAGGSAALLIAAAALVILAPVVKSFGEMSVSEIAKSLITLGVALGELSVALILMNGSIGGAAALVVAAAAIMILAPAIKMLGSLSIGDVAIALITLAGALVVIGAAAVVASALSAELLVFAGTMAAIGAALIIIGAGVATIGAGLVLIGAGIAAIAAAVSVGLTIIVEAIPPIIEAIGQGIVALIIAIGDSAEAIGEAVYKIVVAVVNILIDSIPLLVDGLLQFVVKSLEALVAYTPTIVDLLFDFVILVIEGIAKRIPELIVSLVDVFMAICQGVIDAIGQIDLTTLLEGILGLGLIAGLIAALAAIAPLVPMALLGVLGLGAVIAELALVFVAIGALATIPGFLWLVEEGGKVMTAVGTAIGGFVGGIIGGIAAGITSVLPQIGADLAGFMTNAQPFIDGAKSIDNSLFEGVQILSNAVLLLTGAELLETLASFITGGSPLVKFGAELAVFGASFKLYYDSIKDIDAGVVTASANAAGALAEFAQLVPNQGGLVAIFTGDNTLSTFAEELKPFGKAMKEYSDSVMGINVPGIVKSATAAKALVDFADEIPNQGGFVSLFTGDNTMKQFAEGLKPFGEGLRDYSNAVASVNTEKVAASAAAAQAIVDFADAIPEQGGFVSWFTGDNTMKKFAEGLKPFGDGLKDYSDAIADISTSKIHASASATNAIINVAKTLHDSGWTADGMELTQFGDQISIFAEDLASYSKSVAGSNIDKIIDTARGIEALIDAVRDIPSDGGIFKLGVIGEEYSKFGGYLTEYSNSVAGSNIDKIVDTARGIEALLSVFGSLSGITISLESLSLSALGAELASFGPNFKEYAVSIAGTNTDKVVESASAISAICNALSEMPNQGGLVSWFTGDNTLSKLGEELKVFGPNLKEYSISIAGTNIDKVVDATRAIDSLVSVFANYSGSSLSIEGLSLSSFGSELAAFGPSFKDYSVAIAGTNIDKVIESANAITAICTAIAAIPNQGGLAALFAGDNTLSKLGEELKLFGPGLKEYSISIAGTNLEKVLESVNAIDSLITIFEHISSMSVSIEGLSLSTLGTELDSFGPSFAAYSVAIAGSNCNKVIETAGAIKELCTAISEIPEQGGILNVITGNKSLSKLGEELASFGPNFKSYAMSLAGTNIEKVKASTEAVMGTIDFAKHLKDSGWDPAYSSLGTFGEDLILFGENFKTYYDEMSGVDAATLYSIVYETNQLIEMVQNMEGLDTSAATGFGKALAELGANGIDAFIQNFTDATQRVKDTASDMLDNFIEGANNRETDLKKCMESLMDEAIKKIEDRYTDFMTDGETSMDKMRSGIASKQDSIVALVRTIMNTCITVINNKYSDFYRAGQNAVEGFADGITSYTWLAEARSRAMAQASLNAARRTLDSHSPSREFYKVGTDAVTGFANGMQDGTFMVNGVVVHMGKNAVKTTSESMSAIRDCVENGMFMVNGVVVHSGKNVIDSATKIASEVKNRVEGSVESTTNAAKDMSASLSKIGKVASSEGMFSKGGSKSSPTITPVVDSTELDRWSGRLDALFNSQKVVSLDLGLNNGILGMLSDILDNRNNDDVVAAINDLRNDVAELTDIVGNLQVVMDTGTLVGAIVNPMDEALGEKMVYAGRGMGS